jgi:hypothetical protein
VCSHDPNVAAATNCCAVGHEYPHQPDSFDPYTYQCKSSQEECIAGIAGNLNAYRYPFTPDAAYKNVSEFNSGCALVEWSEDAFHAISSIALKLAEMSRVPRGEDLECLKVCDYDFSGHDSKTGDPGKCPTIDLNSDVVGSLFLFYSSIDPGSYSEDTTLVPMSRIAAQFNVSDEELRLCQRSDVVVSKSGLVQNIGQGCDSAVSFDDQGNIVGSTLSIPPLLSGTMKQSDLDVKWMEYTSPTSTFTVKHSDENYDKVFGGFVQRSGMLFDAVVSEIVNKDDFKHCVRARAPLAVNQADQYILKEDSTDFLVEAMKAYITAIAPYYNPGTGGSPYPGFNDAFEKLTADQADNVVKTIAASAKSGVTIDAAYLVSLSTWMDAGLCHQMAVQDGRLSYDFVRAFEANFIAGKNPSARSFAKSRLLRCVSAQGLLPPKFFDALSTVAKK